MKATSAICGPHDTVLIPRGSEKTDWEVELGVVIGKPGKYIAEQDALAHVAGYCVINDVSERAYQLERGGTWDKGYDTFGPIGPWLVTADEIVDPQDLRIWLEIDGERLQDGSTRTMVFGVAELVSYVSHFMSLESGEIISAGRRHGPKAAALSEARPDHASRHRGARRADADRRRRRLRRQTEKGIAAPPGGDPFRFRRYAILNLDRPSAIDGIGLSGGVGGTGQMHRKRCDLFRRSKPPHRLAGDEGLPRRIVVALGAHALLQ